MTTAQATAAGRAARQAGQPSPSCPHGDEAPELRTAWVAGWVAQRSAELYAPLLRQA